MTHASIGEAILDVMSQVGYVQKKASVKAGNSSYLAATEASFLQAIRPVMIEAGIVHFVVSYTLVADREYTTGSGSTMRNVTLHAINRFMHAPSGTWIDVESMGEGSDSGDKAVNKAMTGAKKYALRQTFSIETGNDPDETSSDELVRAGKSSAGGSGEAPKPLTAQQLGAKINAQLAKHGLEKDALLQAAKNRGLDIIVKNAEAVFNLIEELGANVPWEAQAATEGLREAQAAHVEQAG